MRIVWNAILFLTAFVLTCAGISLLIPAQRIPVVTTKLDYFARHGDEYDTLILGSSRVFRQISPEILDAGMAAGGYPIRTFNSGVDGMRPPEDTYFLEQLLATRKKPLRFVIVESNPIRLVERDEDRDTIRAVYWHDWRRFYTLFRRAFLADPKKKFRRKLTDEGPHFWNHTRYWVQKSSNLGRGHELLYEWIEPLPTPASPVPFWNFPRRVYDFGQSLFVDAPPKEESRHDLGRRLDGYRPAGVEVMPAAEQARYKAEMADFRKKGFRYDEGDPVSRDELLYKKKLIEATGAQMVLVIPPYLGERYFYPKSIRDLPIILNFADPEKNPELYAIENRADVGHTNSAGSAIFTNGIVRQFLDQLNAKAPSH